MVISKHYSASPRIEESYSRREVQEAAQFGFSVLEINIRSFQHPSGFHELPPRSYMAIIAEDPGVEHGCSTSDTESLHVLVGQY